METVTFSDTYVWTLFVQIAILFGAMLIGNIIRTRVPVIKKLYIPSALLGGLVVLLLQLIPAVEELVDESTMQIITYHCLGLGFAAMALKNTRSSRSVSTVKIIESGAIMASSYLLQAITGLVLSIAFFLILGSGFYAAGLILPMGFGQSTGSALSWGSRFETSWGFAGGASYGLAVATIGFIVGSVIGVIYLNIMSRKGKITARRTAADTDTETVIHVPGEIPNAESVDKLSLQVCFVIAAYFLSYLFMNLLSLTGVSAISDLAWGLNFMWALLFGMLIKILMSGLRKTKLVERHYINNYLMDRISGFAFDVMIVAGVVAIDFDALYANLGLLAVTCAAGTIVSFLYVRKAAAQAYPGYELEGFLTNFGTVTGTVSTGMILLREIDPGYTTPAASNIVLQNVPSLVMLAPLLLTMGFAASSLTHTLIMFAVFVILLLVYNIFLFRRRIFKAHYADRQEQPWRDPEDTERS